MALLDRLRGGAPGQVVETVPSPRGVAMPDDVKKRIERGGKRLKQVAARRREAIMFANNQHYVFISDDYLKVTQQSTVAISDGGTMPDHRVRRSHDLLSPILKRKISTAVQRIPGYEVIPSNESEDAYLASQVAEKVAYAGYDKWEIKRATKRLIWNALVTEEGFVGTRWDTSVGPFVDVSEHPEMPDHPDPENPQYIGMGELKVFVFGGLEVMWEPGVEFEDSRWICLESARPVSVVEDEDDFITTDAKLKADAEGSITQTTDKNKAGADLVMVKEYLERPCPKYPQGRRLVMANERIIFPEEDYPKTDNKGNVVDEPCLHRLTYSIDSSSEKGRGLVQSLIDAMRSYDMASNKIQEGIQLGQVPQLMAPEGSIITPITDEPGLVIETDPNVLASSNVKPEWRENYQVPQDVYNERNIAKEELGNISLDSEIPEQVESGKEIQAIYERDQIAWQDFIIDLADIHAALMRDCLTVVQQKYSEERLTKFKGAAGWENLAEFRGADILGQTDVRVDPGSLESRTRVGIEQRILQINNEFPGYFPPPVIVAALYSAKPEKLSETFENDEARVYRIITMIKNGGIWKMPPRPLVPGEEAPLVDPVSGEAVIDYKTGQPFQMESVPGWMPRPFDNADIWKQILETWMKTADYDELQDEAKMAAMLIYKGVLDLESKAAQRRAELQTQMAESAGMSNAAKAGATKAMPTQAGVPKTPEPATGAAPSE